jgi:hypothetical protein
MDSELLKAAFIALALLLFVVFNLFTSKDFRKHIISNNIKLKAKHKISPKKS